MADRARREPRGRRDPARRLTRAPATQQTVDEEAQRIVESAEREVIDLLERERPGSEALARALLRHETLDQPDAYRVAGTPSGVDAERSGNGTLRAAAPARDAA